MRKKTLAVSLLLVLFMASLGSSLLAIEHGGPEQKEIELAPKYKAFLAETLRIMQPKEKEVFLQLKNDQDRDSFIENFWRQRGRRQRGVRANINKLRLARMVQVLDLSEDQVTKIMPEMNTIEKQKQEYQRRLQIEMRTLGQILRRESEPSEEKEIKILLRVIKNLKENLQQKEAEFDLFLAENLSIIQQAKYIIFSQDFYRGLQEQLDNARRTQQRLQLQKKKKR